MLVMMVVVMARLAVVVVMRLVRLAWTLRGPIGQAYGDLHRVDRTALGVLDADRDIREPQAGRKTLQPGSGRADGNHRAQEHVSADARGGIDDSETLSRHRLRNLHRATDKANQLRC